MRVLLVAVLSVLITNCAHSLHLSQVSDFSPTYQSFEKGEPVEASSEQFVVLAFVGQTDYVNDAYKKLQSKCSKGTIQGIVTQYSTDLGFFSWTNRIWMRGLCVPHSAVSAAKS